MQEKKDTRPVFVFGSNLAGRHGRGAAKTAKEEYAARQGCGEGPTGHAYAIPTKSETLKPLPRSEIYYYVCKFKDYAKRNDDLTFNVTAIGTGLAGYTHQEIAPMFNGCPENCQLPDEWAGFI